MGAWFDMTKGDPKPIIEADNYNIIEDKTCNRRRPRRAPRPSRPSIPL